MSCCGNKREALVQQQAASKTIIIKIREDVLFEYTGETALTVKGSVSRTLYRFAQKGDTQLVDYRDVSGMMAVPAVKPCRTQVPT